MKICLFLEYIYLFLQELTNINFIFERELPDGGYEDTEIPIGASFFFPNP